MQTRKEYHASGTWIEALCELCRVWSICLFETGSCPACGEVTKK